ncbi:MAG TPA: hypothetical protein VMH27_04305 [Puia sp.]|nr:hypothetical protein [Puia sp.]
MKRISRIALMTLLSVLLLGGTRAFAGDGKKGHGQNNQGNNNQGNNGGGGLITWIDNLLNDIFGGSNGQGGNNNSQGGNGDSSGWANGGPTGTSGGGTAPIDGGIGLLLAAGVGLGIRKLARRS